MADLGVLSVVQCGSAPIIANNGPTPCHVRLDIDPTRYLYEYHIESGSAHLIVATKVQHVLTSGMWAALYWRETHELVEAKRSDNQGLARFDSLVTDAESYYMVVLTDLEYKSLIFDKLTAV